jgi:hypothetical protein
VDARDRGGRALAAASPPFGSPVAHPLNSVASKALPSTLLEVRQTAHELAAEHRDGAREEQEDKPMTTHEIGVPEASRSCNDVV